jgi:hypothetical protein
MNTEAIRQFDWKHASLLVVTVLVTSVFGLWAWNTLSELYSGPVAQYKHVVAALILLAILRRGVGVRHQIANGYKGSDTNTAIFP